MNNILLTIKDLTYHVERPVIFDVVKQLMEITEISSKTPVRIAGEDDKVMQRGSAIDSFDENLNKWSFDENVSIEVSEDFTVDRFLSTPVTQPEQLMIFRDPDLGIFIKPVYGSSDVTITVRYRAPDKNKATAWRNTIKTRTSMGRDVNLHTLSYSYHLPDETIYILKELHRLRERQGGYGDVFDEYFTKRLTNRANTVSAQDGSNPHWVITETQTRVQGLFDFQGIPDKPEKQDDSSAWLTTFTYKFTYEKPIHVNMVYPSMIHNQLLSRKFRCDYDPYKLENIKKSFTLSGFKFNNFEDTTEILKSIGNKGVSIPGFDNAFIPNSIASATTRVFTALCNITNDNKKLLFNLEELGDISLHSDVLDFIRVEKDYITKTYGSILVMHLYEDSKLKKSASLVIDEDLNVSSVEELDIRKTYRVRLSLVANLHLLTNTTMRRIKSYNIANPSFATKLVRSLNSILKDIGNDADIRSNCLLPDDLVRLGVLQGPYSHSINPVNHPLYDPNDIKEKLVENFFVTVSSKSEK